MVSYAWTPLAVAAALACACIAPAVRTIAARDRRLARQWAQRSGTTLVEPAMLAARDEDRRATTILVRHLLRRADTAGIAVTARPWNDERARAYRTLGFGPVPGGRGRILLRQPGRHGHPTDPGGPGIGR